MTTRLLTIRAALVLTAPVTAQTLSDPLDNPRGGSLLVAIWDPSRGVSLTYAVPAVTYQDLRDGAIDPFQTQIPSFAAVFTSSTPGNLMYSVFSAGLFARDFPDFPMAALFVTGPPDPGTVINANVLGGVVGVRVVHANLDVSCVNPSICPSFERTSGAYAGNDGDLTTWLPFSAAGRVGTPLVFWDLSQVGLLFAPPLPPVFDASAQATVVDSERRWLLTADGMLTYSVVPLPAGVWLLLSAIAVLLRVRCVPGVANAMKSQSNRNETRLC